MKKRVALIVGIVILLAVAHAIASTFTASYNYNQDVVYTNQSGGDIEQPLLLPINAVELIEYNYIQPDAEDVTIQYLGQEEYITAMNLSGSPSSWRLEYTDIPAGNAAKKTLWFGNSSGTRNQRWIASGEDWGRIVDSGSFVFSGTQSFSIFVDVIPAVETGTEQIIFQKGDSYRLSYMPGPEYRFMLDDTVSGTVAATIDAEVNTEAQLIAWYNGAAITGPEFLLCDAVSGVCDSGTMSSLVPDVYNDLIIAECDCILDDYAVRTPMDWQMPGGGGTPVYVPVCGGVPYTVCDTYITPSDPYPTCYSIRGSYVDSIHCYNDTYCPLRNYTWTYPTNPNLYLRNVGSQVLSKLNDGDLYSTAIYVNQDTWDDHTTYRDASIYLFGPLVDPGTITDDTELDWVAVNVYGSVLDSYPGVMDSVAVTLHANQDNTAEHYFQNIALDYGNYCLSSGSYTLNTSGVNWTMGDLVNGYDSNYIGIEIKIDVGHVSPNNSGMRLHEINEIEVCYKVSE